jgi:hypothetical protein
VARAGLSGVPAPAASGEDQDRELPPPGHRWGAGAESVLPYLTRTLQAKPSGAMEPREPRARNGHPVFANWPPGPAGR